MYLIVGLGNPGKEYDQTRHNIGFHYLDCFAQANGVSFQREKFHGQYTEFSYQGEKIILLKPQLYMNLSGEVVSKFVDFFDIPLSNVLIMHDDLDLPLGKFRLRANGSSGGHNGLKDIEKYLKTQEYQRLKIGVSHDRSKDTKDYVLGKFSMSEKEQLIQLQPQIMSLLQDFLKLKFDQLMCQYNQK